MKTTRGFPDRPPRIELLQAVRPLYFVTFNTHGRAKLLANARVHEAFRTFAGRAHSEHAVAVGRYVLMPDHIHLFVALPPDGLRLVAWIKSLKAVLGKLLLQAGICKPHWQEGFFDHVLRHSESYSLKWEYVRLNPVRAGLVENPDEWPWQGEVVRIEF
jgi:REP element-mobilizing transposase RayT